MPLFEERYKVLTEAGRVLCEVRSQVRKYLQWSLSLQKFNGSVANLLEQCARSGRKLVDLVVNNFESYRDVATYKGAKGETV